jgi:transposase-like protein
VGRARQPHDDHALGPSVREYEKRWNRRAKPVGSSWRVDETYIRTQPKTGYLYRAVDKQGRTVESLFQTERGIAAAMAFFRKAVVSRAPRWPRRITLDGNKQSHWGLRRLRREDRRWKYVLVRNSQYLNNLVEQDHRAIKGRCRPMLGFKSYRTAAVTLAGIELAHRIRKRQFKFGPGRWICWSLKKQWDKALA